MAIAQFVRSITPPAGGWFVAEDCRTPFSNDPFPIFLARRHKIGEDLFDTPNDIVACLSRGKNATALVPMVRGSALHVVTGTFKIMPC
jgi:hypothetical protein